MFKSIEIVLSNLEKTRSELERDFSLNHPLETAIHVERLTHIIEFLSPNYSTKPQLTVKDLKHSDIGFKFDNGSYVFEVMEILKRTNKTLTVRYKCNDTYNTTTMRLFTKLKRIK